VSAILALVSSMFPALLDAFKRREERKQAEQSLVLARIEPEKLVAMETVRQEYSLGTTQIKSTGSALKYISYGRINSPIICAVFFPDKAKMLFENLKLIPPEILMLIVSINFAVWGLPVARNALSNIVTGLGEFARARAEVKLSRQAIFQSLKAAQGPMNQAQVDTINKVLDVAQVPKV